MPEWFLPERAFRGRESKKLQFTVLAAAVLRGRAEPDLLGEVAWWQTDDFWQYALCGGGRLYPRRRQPSRRAGARGMPGTGPGAPDRSRMNPHSMAADEPGSQGLS